VSWVLGASHHDAKFHAPLFTFAPFTIVESPIMGALGRFGFTPALIFPYDKLVFCRSGGCLGGEAEARRNALFL
jgi:hypothetical protein